MIPVAKAVPSATSSTGIQSPRAAHLMDAIMQDGRMALKEIREQEVHLVIDTEAIRRRAGEFFGGSHRRQVGEGN